MDNDLKFLSSVISDYVNRLDQAGDHVAAQLVLERSNVAVQRIRSGVSSSASPLPEKSDAASPDQ